MGGVIVLIAGVSHPKQIDAQEGGKTMRFFMNRGVLCERDDEIFLIFRMNVRKL